MNQTSTRKKKTQMFEPKRLPVARPFRVLIVEKMIDIDGESMIEKNSRINCGICGGCVGQITSDIHFPFSVHALKSRLSNSRLLIRNQIRCTRKECNNIIFHNLKQVSFVSFDQFKDLQSKAREENDKIHDRQISVLVKERRKRKVERFVLRLILPFKKLTRWFKNLFVKK